MDEAFRHEMHRMLSIFDEMQSVIKQLVPGVSTDGWSRIFFEAYDRTNQLHTEALQNVRRSPSTEEA